jgi:hypothetical protein
MSNKHPLHPVGNGIKAVLTGKLPNQSGETPMSFIDRLHNEKSELHHRLTSLEKFIGSAQFNSIPITQQTLLIAQVAHMASYHHILITRLRLLEQSEPLTAADRENFRSRAMPELDDEFPEVKEVGDYDPVRDGPVAFKG